MPRKPALSLFPPSHPNTSLTCRVTAALSDDEGSISGEEIPYHTKPKPGAEPEDENSEDDDGENDENGEEDDAE
jgi:hypothetical protein